MNTRSLERCTSLSSTPDLNLSSVIDRSVSNSITNFSSFPETQTPSLSISITNVYQPSDIVALPEPSSSHESVNIKSIENSTDDNISDALSSTSPNILALCSSIAATDNTISHEDELQKLQSDEINSCLINDVHMANS
ncbi:unnamed protein product [Rotaria sp. Silwood2]|nr:unnamed protein product [Rotaria sp. Silwood2]CAF2930791.1 unnamed protein product [Rotaria sp. Silwood2]CAF4085778.1 unnamed protein product [Rotaria sp. Silwood2]CAF4164140.1 unnamed protein product [Rotaria sp. Silwood2]